MAISSLTTLIQFPTYLFASTHHSSSHCCPPQGCICMTVMFCSATSLQPNDICQTVPLHVGKVHFVIPSPLLQLSTPEMYPAWLGSYYHGCVVWLWKWINQLYLKIPQNDRHNGLDLQVCKVGAHATMPASTKANERKRLLQSHQDDVSSVPPTPIADLTM